MRTKSDPVNVYVGSRIRHRRRLIGMSQTEFGNALGLTFQQIQKYEKGSNRISASKLHQISEILDTPISFFFDGMAHTVTEAQSQSIAQPAPHDLLAHSDTVAVLRAYLDIHDKKICASVVELLEAITCPDKKTGGGQADPPDR